MIIKVGDVVEVRRGSSFRMRDAKIDNIQVPMTDEYEVSVMKVDTEKHLKPVFQYLKKMKNLYNLGRNANFEYMHTHEIFRRSQRLICQLDNFNNKF